MHARLIALAALALGAVEVGGFRLGAGASRPARTQPPVSRLAVRMYETPITISGNNVELTDSMKAYVAEKVGGVLQKMGGPTSVSRCDAHLSIINNPRVAQSHTCEVVVFSKGTVIRAAERTESMYASIDMVAAKLGRKLRKLKERRQDKSGNLPTPELFGAPDGDEPEETAAVAATVVRTKRFQMPPQSVEDAIVCLEYVDHPFYVFTNSATGEINVIYKRNSGGIGLIEPDK